MIQNSHPRRGDSFYLSDIQAFSTSRLSNMNNSTGNYTAFLTSFPFEEFMPVLPQCYLILIIGYLVARFQLLSAADQRGASAFISYIGMPGIVCVTLADADLSDLSWELLLGLFLGKLVIFLLVVTMAIAITGNLGIAGVLGVFIVHCNDLPVGNPIMTIFYEEHRPQMKKYLFFMPFLTMIFFLPAGQLLIALQKTYLTKEKEPLKEVNVWRKGFEAVSNTLLKAAPPVVFATTFGIIFNIIFQRHMPEALHRPLRVIANVVPGTVLAVLGFSFIRKERYLFTSAIVTAFLLLVIKMFFTPIIMHTIIKFFVGESISSRPLTDFGLLYGVVSPATAIFLSGQEFRKPLAAMSATLILTSLLSFPTSFVVARFTLVQNKHLNEYVPELKKFLFWIASLSIISDISVWISILWKKKGFMFPYSCVLCLVSTQILLSCGIIVWYFDLINWKYGGIYLPIVLCYGGENSCYIWAATAATVFSSNKQDIQEKRFGIIAFLTFGICIMLTSMMCLLVYFNKKQIFFFAGHPESSFEFLQLTSTTVILAICFVIVSVTVFQHFKKGRSHGIPVAKTIEFDNHAFFLEIDDVIMLSYKNKRPSISSRRFSTLSRKDEAAFYNKENNPLHSSQADHSAEFPFRFYSLLLILMIIMFIRLVANLYKLADSSAMEIMIPLEFFQSTLFIGQGVFLFLIFGMNPRIFTIKIKRSWRKLRYGKDEVVAEVSSNERNKATALFCDKFRAYFIKQCFQKLAKDRKWKSELYEDCFWGHQLVDWMIEEGIAKDDVEAEELGQKLLVGGVIKHVSNSHNFYDAPYLYQFIAEEKDSSYA